MSDNMIGFARFLNSQGNFTDLLRQKGYQVLYERISTNKYLLTIKNGSGVVICTVTDYDVDRLSIIKTETRILANVLKSMQKKYGNKFTTAYEDESSYA